MACGPGGIAEADGGFAKKLLDVCSKYAAKKPDPGFMHWPSDLVKHKWPKGGIWVSGGSDYLVPFGSQEQQMEERKVALEPKQQVEEREVPLQQEQQ